jgi:hypothetical protein
MTSKLHNAVTRETILALLTDAEVAKISHAEDSRPIEGDESVDLHRPDSGVHQIHAESHVAAGHILPRSAVSDETWARIIKAVTRE